MAVNRANFARMIQTEPQLIARLTTLLAERIWLIYKQLANTLINDPLGRMYDVLLIQLEKKRVDVTTTKSFTFDFGTRELINMVGLSQGDGELVIRKLLENHCFQILHDKIYVMEMIEIAKQTTYYRKMQQLEKARKNHSATYQGYF